MKYTEEMILQSDSGYCMPFEEQQGKGGARTVLITAKNKDIFGEFCSEVVLLPSLKHLNHGNLISPQFPILVMLDIIYSYYVEQDKYQKEVLHDNTLRALEEGRTKHRDMFE